MCAIRKIPISVSEYTQVILGNFYQSNVPVIVLDKRFQKYCLPTRHNIIKYYRHCKYKRLCNACFHKPGCYNVGYPIPNIICPCQMLICRAQEDDGQPRSSAVITGQPSSYLNRQSRNHCPQYGRTVVVVAQHSVITKVASIRTSVLNAYLQSSGRDIGQPSP